MKIVIAVTPTISTRIETEPRIGSNRSCKHLYPAGKTRRSDRLLTWENYSTNIAANLGVFVSGRVLCARTHSLFSNLRLPPTATWQRESFGPPHASRLAVRCAHRDPHGAGNFKADTTFRRKR